MWDARFIELAKHISTWSKDPSKGVGCVMVGKGREILSTGYNGFPRGVEDDCRLNDRFKKYPIIVHAEENAIINATRVGVSLKGSTAYVTWQPCSRCARMLIQVGVEEIVTPACEVVERWKDDFEISEALLREAGVPLRVI